MINPSFKSNHEVDHNEGGENPLAGHNLPSRPVNDSPAASIVNNARKKFPSANVTKVQLAEAWTKVVCRYGSALNSADAIDSVLLARKFSEETGIKLPKKLNDMLGDTARRAIKCELNNALEGIFRTRFTSISDVKTCILSALEIAKKTGIDPTNKQNAIIERFANYIIQGGLAEMSESTARKIYLNAANSVLPVLEIVKETKRELTTEQKKKITENAPDMIQASLKRALWLLGEGYANLNSAIFIFSPFQK
ncbi:MAG: hypothetical protein ACOX2O_01165 [Bdellovibrionota bacterium]|jgi:hypothetical protein